MAENLTGWDDDDFWDGDIEFDMDFEKPKRGFLSSVGSGFFAGLKAETIGSTDAIIRNMRRGLPSSFSTAFNQGAVVVSEFKNAVTDIKAASADLMDDLTYFSGVAAEKLRDKLPNKITDGLDTFSQKDFSSWAGDSATDTNSLQRMDGVDESDISMLMDDIANRQVQAQIESTAMMADVFNAGMSRNAAASMMNNKALITIDTSLRKIHDYQVRVQQHNDQIKINLLSRQYLTSAKYYKFMEAAMHRQVEELRLVAKNAALSDYEKTSLLQASKSKLRDSIFSSTFGRVGGFAGALAERFTGGGVKELAEVLGGLTGDLRIVSELSEGQDVNAGEMIGKLLAKIAVEKGPGFFIDGKGKGMLQKLRQRFPNQTKRFDDFYKQLSEVGDVLSYASTAGAGLIDSHISRYGNIDSMDLTYDDYLENIKPGQRKLSKFQFDALIKAGNLTAGGINNLSYGATDALGTRYQLSQRNLKQLMEPGVWNNQSVRTVNEVLPRLMSMIVANTESMRIAMGGPEVKPLAYDFRQSKLVSNARYQKSLVDSAIPKRELKSFTSSMDYRVDQLDTDKTLSRDARRALGITLGRSADKGHGINPYDLLDLSTNQYVSESSAKEIRELVIKRFGLSEQDIEAASDSSVSGLFNRLVLPTAEGKRLANELSVSMQSLGKFTPDLSARIDTAINLGGEDALREAGLIKNVDGVRSIDEERIWKALFDNYYDNEDTPSQNDVESLKRKATVSRVTGRKRPMWDTQRGLGEGLDTSVFENLAQTLTETSDKFVNAIDRMGRTGTNDNSELESLLSKTNSSIASLVEINNQQLDVLTNLLSRAPATGTTPDANLTESERKDVKTKKGLIERIKSFSPKGMFTSGIETLMAAQPLVLGGMLGGLATSLFTSSSPAILLGGAVGAAALYTKMRVKAASMGSEPSDDEDLRTAPDEDPILYSDRMKRGEYFDQVTKKVIDSWSQVKNTVVDASGNVIATAKELGGKLFGKDGRAVMLKGLNWLKTNALKAFNALDFVGRGKNMLSRMGRLVYQSDVFRIGEKTPVLRRSGFKAGEYYCLINDDYKVITGWDEISGPVYDQSLNVLLTQEEIDAGLITRTGIKIEGLKRFGSNFGSNLMKGADWLKQRAMGAAGAVKDKVGGGGQDRVVHRLDLIYSILCKQFGFKADVTIGADSSAAGRILDMVNAHTPDDGLETHQLRAGSLADKERIKKEEKEDQVKESIIEIADVLKGGGKDGDKEKDDKKKGLLGGLLGFLRNPIQSLIGKGGAFGLIGHFLNVGIKSIPLIATGVGIISKGIWGLTKLVGTLVRNLFGWGGPGGAGDDYYVDENGKKQKKGKNDKTKGNRGKAKPKTRRPRLGVGAGFGRMAKGAGVAAGIGMATDMVREWGDVEEDSMADWLLTGTDYAGMAYGGYQVASAAAGMFGTSLGGVLASGASMLGTGLSAVGTGLMTGLTTVAPLLLNPVTLTAAAVGGVGWMVYQYYNRGKGKQFDLRMAQYGFEDTDSDVAAKIRNMEEVLNDYVIFSGGQAKFSQDTPLQDVFQPFLTNPNNPKETSQLYAWFNLRFKPVYLTYKSGLEKVQFTNLKAYDESQEPRVYQVAKQVHQALLMRTPCPYDINPDIDNDIHTLDRHKTLKLIDGFFKDLEKYNERHGRSADGTIAVNEHVVSTVDEQVKRSDEAGFWRSAWMMMNGEYMDSEDKAKLDARFQQPDLVKEYDVSDMMSTDGKPMDILTSFRLAAYGNDKNVPWRVEAVLKLERWMENNIQMVSRDIRFTGKSSDAYNLFKASFQCESVKDSGNWLLWFRDRFLPVYLTWHRELHNAHRQVPSRVWKTLSATNRYNVARKISEIKTKSLNYKGEAIGIWFSTVSPFPSTISLNVFSSEAKNWLTRLEYQANDAKLIDDNTEAKKSGAEELTRYNEMRDSYGNVPGAPGQAGADIINRLNESLVTAAGGDARTVQGIGMTPNQFEGANLQYRAIEANVNEHVDLSGVIAKGNDNGISVPKSKAEQLLINEMVKEGFTDPRQIAEMLALTHYETGGYSRTAENMKYTDAARAQKIFGKLQGMTVDEIQALIQQGPIAFANKVYGGWLGNTEPNDGWLFRGRGLVQLTGRDMYTKAAKDIGIDIVNNPQLVSENPEVMVKTAMWYFKNNKQLQSIAQNGDFQYAARGLNNGKALPGMPARYQLYRDYLQKLVSGQLGTQGDQTADLAAQSTQQAPSMKPVNGNATGSGFSPEMLQSNYQGLETADNENGTPAPAGGFPSSYNPQTGDSVVDAGIRAGTAIQSGAGSRVSNYDGLTIKQNESVEGGPVHPGLIRMCREIQSKVPNFKYFSALNDGYHQRKSPTSYHTKGLALDYTLTNGGAGASKAVAVTHDILRSAGMVDKTDYLIIDEYAKLSAKGTGGHVHFNFKSDGAAQKFLTAMGGSAQGNSLEQAAGAVNQGPMANPVSAYQQMPSNTDATAAAVDAVKANNLNPQQLETSPNETAQSAPNRPMTSASASPTQEQQQAIDTAQKALQQMQQIGKGEINVQAMKPETEAAVLSQAQLMAQLVAEMQDLNKNLNAPQVRRLQA